ncbi:MAG: hypothetical protein IMY75_12345, partial [Chloroflexi bacterium]|nr:hypothetical protein [Chloroflexota bacterium]
YLVGVEMVTRPLKVDLDKVGTIGGDFKGGELDVALLESGIVDDVCETVDQYAADKKAIIFTVSVRQAVQISERLAASGYAASHISGETPKDIRRQRLRDFAEGKITHMVNCMVLCLDTETEILTDHGWTGVDQMSMQHKVANWDDGKVFFTEPLEIARRQRGKSEPMYVLETRTRSIRVTGKHRMVHRANSNSKWVKSPVDNLEGKGHQLPVNGLADPEIMEPVQERCLTEKEVGRLVSSNSYALRENNGLGMQESKDEAYRRLKRRMDLRRKRPDELTLDECRFIGFWLGDGTVTKLQSGGVEYAASQALVYPLIVKWFDSVIQGTGLDFARRENNGTVPHVRWGFGRGTGGGCQERKGVFEIEQYLDKNGTPLLNGLSVSRLLALLEGFWHADGNHGDASGGLPEHFTISNCNKMLLDRIQAVAVVRGFSASVTKTGEPKEPHHRQLWTLGVQRKQYHQMSVTGDRYSIQKEKEPWKPERVWCVKTTTKNIITRRNGRVTVMGNTEGFDDPGVNCIIMARPTKSKSLYTQCVGRGLRIAPNKDRCLIIDMVGLSSRHTLIQAPVIFGLEGTDNDTAEPSDVSPDEEVRLKNTQSLLLSQIQGIEPVSRSQLRWIPAKHGSLVLSCGEGGTVIMRRVVGNEWMVDVIGRGSTGARESLTMEPVGLELAQGIAEDYVRRAQAVYLTDKSAAWRDAPASEKQKQALTKWKISFHDGITKGEASDLMTQASASNWRHDPATEKQLSALARMGVQHEAELTKGQAGRLLNENRRR